MSVVTTLFYFFLALAAGSTAYTLIAIFALLKYRFSNSALVKDYLPPVSIIKPLYGLDRRLEENLESFFIQNYPQYEILFSVRDLNDPAVAVVNRVKSRHPEIPVKLIATGHPIYLNAKVHGMEEMAKIATHEILVINDSDVLVGPEYLRQVVAPLADPKVGLVTCISRAVPESSIGSVLEALTINTQFAAGVLSAWLLIGVEFALGPTMVTRKKQLDEIGGMRALADYLADDFVLGELVAKAGYQVVLSKEIPDHLFGGAGFIDTLNHRLRWERSSRISRPAGYLGQIFMHNIPLSLLAMPWIPSGNPIAWAILASCIVTRFLLAWGLAGRLLRCSTIRTYWWLLPVADLVSFGIWCWAFVGSEIVWRGTRFRVLRGGKLEPVR